jgi:hypothetical protein
MIGRLLCEAGWHRRGYRAVWFHPVLAYVYCRRPGCPWVQS